MAKASLKLVLLCFIVTACTSKGNWKHNQVNSGTEQFSSSRLSYVFPDPNNGIEMEILRTKEACRGYLFVHSHPILPHENDSKKALVLLNISGESFSCIAIRHEGGHRVLLPEETLQKILLGLKEGSEVLIETSGYKTKINPEGFNSLYLKFQNPSKLPSLIQLPL